jgi:hypothetical protein
MDSFSWSFASQNMSILLFSYLSSHHVMLKTHELSLISMRLKEEIPTYNNSVRTSQEESR